jgi:integrase
MTARPVGRRVKVVRKVLADGTVREYRYDQNVKARKDVSLQRQNAIHKIALQFYNSPEYARVTPRWQNILKYYVMLIEDEIGWMTVDDLNDRKSRGEFFNLRDKHAATPAKADKLMNTLRTLLKFGYERALVDYNHAAGIPKLVPSGHSRRENVWTLEHEAALFGTGDQDVCELYQVALFTVMRKSDLCRLQWPHFDGRWLSMKTAKTGAWGYWPVYALTPLRTLFDGLSRGTSHVLTSAARGQPWTPENISKRFRQTMAKAGLAGEDLHFHDIRGTGITRMLEAGCTDAEVAAISTHSVGGKTTLGDYAGRTQRLALNAYIKWNADLTGESAIIGFQRPGGNRGK